MNILNQALLALEVPLPAREVYADLVAHGSSPARSIAVRTGMTRPSVYDQLNILIGKNLVVERELDGKTAFAIRDVRDIGRFLELEEERLSAIRASFVLEQESLAKRTETVDPKIRFVSGRDAINRAMHDMLWDERLILKAVWPYDEMLRALGAKALAEFNVKRIRSGLRLKTIWSPPPKSGDAHIWKDGDTDVERRIAPNPFAPKMAYTVYGDKVLFVSSAAESFGFVVHSADFATLMSLQFDVLWNVSKKKRG
jgi:sugar-specific transcriptional regulator TrmB